MDCELNNQISEVLEDGLSYMKAVLKNYIILTGAISSGNQDEIAKNFQDLREGLHWVEDASKNFEILLKLDYSTIMIGKQSIKKIIENYNKFVLTWENAYNSGDYNKLRELTETEHLKQIKKMTSVFNKIKKMDNTEN